MKRKINKKDISILTEVIITSALILFTYSIRMPFLTFVMAINSLLIAICVAGKIIFKNAEDVNKGLILCFVNLAASVLYYVFFGAIGTGTNRFLNLLLSSAAFLILCVLIPVTKRWNMSYKRLLSGILSFILVAAIIFYNLTMNFAASPTTESLQKGHDEYLYSISKSKTNNVGPNVLIVLMDDLGYADIGKYAEYSGKKQTVKTPNIDSLCDEGVMFTNFSAACPVCAPSRAGILTGRYPTRAYVDGVFFPTVSLSGINISRLFNTVIFSHSVDGLLGDEITIAESLKAAGYNTGAFGKWHLGDYGEYLPTNQGFDTFYGSYYSNDMSPYNIYKNDTIDIKEADLQQADLTQILEEQVISFIDDSVSDNENFFAYYASPWPHDPVSASDSFQGKSDAGLYGDCIEEFDDSLGNIIGFLKDKGVYDNTLIIFTSDNGPWQEGSTGGLRGRKNTAFNGGYNVPFIVCYPNGFYQSGRIVTSPTSGIDIFPTVLSVCGVDMPTDRIIDGVDLSGLLNGKADADSAVHDNIFYIQGGDIKAVQTRLTVNGKTSDFKYFDKVSTDNAAYFYQKHTNILINLDSDEQEAYDLCNTYPEVAVQMKNSIDIMQGELKENRRGIIE